MRLLFPMVSNELALFALSVESVVAPMGKELQA
jgi:hypothetical protein